MTDRLTIEGALIRPTTSRIAIIGTGYVGLTTGVCFAHLGHTVVCADVDEEKVAQLSRGETPILEHRLDELLADGLRSGRLQFVVGAANAVRGAEVVFLCVPTPQGEDGAADLRYVEAAAAEISEDLEYESIVVNKSTVPVGSARVVERVLKRPDVRVVSNPEFLREGSAVEDFLKPSRVVIGADDRAAAMKVGDLYSEISPQLVITDPASAEMIKYSANAFLATKLSFVNAIAAVCEGVGANVDEVMVGVGFDPRIGSEFLRPGPGWGGSCFPKDSRALIKLASDAGYPFELLEGVIAVNEAQFDRMVDKVRESVGGDLTDRNVAVWGLTFKARTDDLRESPSLSVIDRLLGEGARVTAFDPTVPEHRVGVPAAVNLAADSVAATAGADALVILTEWDDFRWVEPEAVADVMPGREVIDTRNLLDRASWQRSGFRYTGVGR